MLFCAYFLSCAYICLMISHTTYVIISLFSEKCMQTRVREVGTGCPICQKDTHGVLNHAQKLVAKKRRLVGRDGSWEDYLQKSKGGEDEGDRV